MRRSSSHGGSGVRVVARRKRKWHKLMSGSKSDTSSCIGLVLVLVLLLLLLLIPFFYLENTNFSDPSLRHRSISSTSNVDLQQQEHISPSFQSVNDNQKNNKDNNLRIGLSQSPLLLLHIVETRFMQDQPNLKWLARARLQLFEYICLPTMIHQTTQDFLWFIQIDSDLDAEIMSRLLMIVQPYPNVYVVSTSTSSRALQEHRQATRQRQWNDFRNATPLEGQQQVHTGNVEWLRRAHANRAAIPIILQTRLDADDGLELHYLELLQQDAKKLFLSPFSTQQQQPPQLKWYYWCVRRLMEWHPDTNRLLPIEHSRLCVTPGLTVATTPTTTSSSTADEEHNALLGGVRQHAPFYIGHDILFKELEKKQPGYCGTRNVHPCIRMVDELTLGAVRSRTLTSAGMMDVEDEQASSSSNSKNLKQQAAYWQMVTHEFAIDQAELQHVQQFLKQHEMEIARDNLEGQCTEGHSCKLKSVEALQRLMDVQREQNGGHDMPVRRTDTQAK